MCTEYYSILSHNLEIIYQGFLLHDTDIKNCISKCIHLSVFSGVNRPRVLFLKERHRDYVYRQLLQRKRLLSIQKKNHQEFDRCSHAQ